MLSVQKKDWSIGKLISSLDILSSFVETAAAESSSLGMVTGFIGASLDFPIRNEHLTFPKTSSILI